MHRLVLSILLAVAVAGCSDPEPAAKTSKTKQEQAEKQHQEDRDRELALFGNPATAGPEIDRILKEWIDTSDGTLIAKSYSSQGRMRSIHVLASSASWLATCENGRVSVTIGPWIDGDKDGVGPVIIRRINRHRLTDDHCAALAKIVGSKLAVLFAPKQP